MIMKNLKCLEISFNLKMKVKLEFEKEEGKYWRRKNVRRGKIERENLRKKFNRERERENLEIYITISDVIFTSQLCNVIFFLSHDPDSTSFLNFFHNFAT